MGVDRLVNMTTNLLATVSILLHTNAAEFQAGTNLWRTTELCADRIMAVAWEGQTNMATNFTVVSRRCDRFILVPTHWELAETNTVAPVNHPSGRYAMPPIPLPASPTVAR